TAAPGRAAPVASRTTPVMRPAAGCAWAGAPETTAARARAVRKGLRSDIMETSSLENVSGSGRTSAELSTARAALVKAGGAGDLAALHDALAGQAEARLGLLDPARQEVGGVAADRRPVLEAVAGPRADEQRVGPARMAVDQQVAVRAVLVLADAPLH